MRIIIDDNKVEISGTKGDVLAGLTKALHAMYHDGMATKADLKKVLKIAMMSEEDIETKANEVEKCKKDMHKKVCRMLEDLSEEQMDELVDQIQENYEDGISESEFEELCKKIKEEV